MGWFVGGIIAFSGLSGLGVVAGVVLAIVVGVRRRNRRALLRSQRMGMQYSAY